MFPVLWLCGPPGAGKTTVAWEIYSHLPRAAFADIDQLGICYPEPADDPGRHRMKARNLSAVAARFHQAGARCLVVSGVLDAVPEFAPTVCRLRADPDVLRQRFLGRGGDPGMLAAVLREAEALDRSDFPCVDTDGISVAEVALLVEGRTSWPIRGSRPPVVVEPERPDGPVLWLCGLAGVGKSTVGFEVYQRILRSGRTAAYVDLDQIGFCPGADHRLKARNLAALWDTYRTAGADAMVVTGQVQDETAFKNYTDELSNVEFTLCRLYAGREELTRRILQRGQGGSWPQPGDPLLGQPIEHLRRIAALATNGIDTVQIGAVHIDTDGKAVEQAADAVLNAWPWHSRPAG